mmetsp:Transcript_18816/g.17973  ORF Transcript_18816/g.17973 Transcript_18816/m.17973 type:complete len:82 (+) Transcript_18816:228-473(+)
MYGQNAKDPSRWNESQGIKSIHSNQRQHANHNYHSNGPTEMRSIQQSIMSENNSLQNLHNFNTNANKHHETRMSAEKLSYP